MEAEEHIVGQLSVKVVDCWRTLQGSYRRLSGGRMETVVRNVPQLVETVEVNRATLGGRGEWKLTE